MTPTHLELTRRCPACGAVVEQREGKCWLCARPLAAPAEAPTPAFRSRAPSGEFQFSLGTLFLVMTLIAVHLGLLVALPALGVPLLVVGMLALVRTVAHLGRLPDEQPTLTQKIEVWFVSMAATVVALLFSSIGFLAAGLMVFVVLSVLDPLLPGRNGLLAILGLLGLVLCGAAQFVVFAGFYWMTLPPAPAQGESPPAPVPPLRRTGTAESSAAV